jgi:hypothetical protein
METRKNKSFRNHREEEKVSKDNMSYISSLNNQIINLEAQIKHLQNKVSELSTQNSNIEKDKQTIKNYEKIIETERYKAKKADNTIYKLRQEIDNLKKTYNNNLMCISKMKKINNNNNFIHNYNKKISMKLNQNKDRTLDIENQSDSVNKISKSKSSIQFYEDLNKENDRLNKIKANNIIDNNKEKEEKKDPFINSNSNDIIFRISDENERSDIVNQQNEIFATSREVDLIDKYDKINDKYNINNNFLYSISTFNKMKGSDINNNTTNNNNISEF